jgi:UDP-4-amino-4,6-dideoxy-N-acetyl-beta-L-altrosamine transaminase
MIPYSKQLIDNKDIKSAVKVLRSDLITQGPIVKEFEKKLAKFCNAKFAIALNSATAGLHIACLALGLKKGDYLWTSPISFVASANCGIYCGAKIDFVDINNSTFNMDVIKLEEKLIKAKKNKKLPKILIPVHLGGLSCDMKKIFQLSKKYKFKIIEDASHALGSYHGNYKVGSCKYSDLTVFSFHPVKIITTGEGGAVLSNNKKIFQKLTYMQSSGINKNLPRKKIARKGLWFYEQVCIGFNYRMNEISAALGRSQLEKVNSFTKKRNSIAKKYISSFKNTEIKIQKIPEENYSSYHLFIIRVNKDIRKSLFSYLRKKNYFVNVHYIPIYKHPFYKKLFKNFRLIEAENYYNESISIPIYPNLKKTEVNRVIKIVKNYINNNGEKKN